MAKFYLKDYKGAIQDCDKAIKLDSTEADFYYSKGKIYQELEKNKQAIENYSKAIQLDQRHKKALFYRGNLQKKLGKNKDDYCLDWSKAEELGYEQAYNQIKKYCK